jgi:hypothetical protein
MRRDATATLAFAALLASWTGCGGTNRQTTIYAATAPRPDAVAAGELSLRATADRAVRIERYLYEQDRWELVCTTPCERVLVPTRGTYRFTMGAISSRPFGMPEGRDNWIVLELGPDGSVWTRDSPRPQAKREGPADVAAALLLKMFLECAAEVAVGH